MNPYSHNPQWKKIASKLTRMSVSLIRPDDADMKILNGYLGKGDHETALAWMDEFFPHLNPAEYGVDVKSALERMADDQFGHNAIELAEKYSIDPAPYKAIFVKHLKRRKEMGFSTPHGEEWLAKLDEDAEAEASAGVCPRCNGKESIPCPECQ